MDVHETLRRLRGLAFVRHARQFLELRGLLPPAVPSSQRAGPDGDRDLQKLRLFGFDKRAVGLCYSAQLDRCGLVSTQHYATLFDSFFSGKYHSLGRMCPTLPAL